MDVDSESLAAIDTQALNGLRAVAAIHVLLSNAFIFCNIPIDLLGCASASLFFILSGYIMALRFGNRILIPHTSNTSLTIQNVQSWLSQERVWLFVREFLTRRLSKILPIYFIGLLVDFHFFSLFLTSTNLVNFSIQWPLLTSWIGETPINQPLWQLSTFLFIYLSFPFVLPWLQGRKKRFRWYAIFFSLSIIIYGCLLTTGYTLARAFPPGRLFVFLMGAILGLERIKPIPQHIYNIFYGNENWDPENNRSREYTDVFCAGYLFLLIIAIVSSVWLKSIIRIFIEAFSPYFQGIMIYSLTTKNAKDSLSYQLLNNSILIYIGRISFYIYVFQDPVFRYLSLILFDIQSGELFAEKHYNFPKWFIPAVIGIVIAIASLVYEVFELRLYPYLLSKLLKRNETIAMCEIMSDSMETDLDKNSHQSQQLGSKYLSVEMVDQDNTAKTDEFDNSCNEVA